MSYFTDQVLKQLDEHKGAVQGKYRDLLLRYTTRTFKNPKTSEFANHGFCRRLKVLVRCIDNVYSILPPEREDVPTEEEVSDCVINLQALILNVFGAIDNLAWVLVLEKSIRRPDGSDLPPTWVGLRKANEHVRNALSAEMRHELEKYDGWFGYMENFRHASAHRIPLYVPPHIVDPKNTDRYHELDHLIYEALRRSDLDEHERLVKEQASLTFFRPWMTHSFSEGPGTITFHSQIICDFYTVEALGWNVLEELDRPLQS